METPQKHPTPEQWSIEHPFGESGTYISDKVTTALIAKVYRETDAPLIVAARELLSILKRLVDYYSPNETRPEAVSKLNTAKALIEKIENTP